MVHDFTTAQSDLAQFVGYKVCSAVEVFHHMSMLCVHLGYMVTTEFGSVTGASRESFISNHVLTDPDSLGFSCECIPKYTAMYQRELSVHRV